MVEVVTGKIIHLIKMKCERKWEIYELCNTFFAELWKFLIGEWSQLTSYNASEMRFIIIL